MIYSDEIIQRIKEETDIVDFIGGYVSLKKRGQNYIGLCPFHGEKTPSFNVNPSMGIYKCFGCGESGDVIEFLRKYENLDFKEAVEILAERARIPLEQSKEPERPVSNNFYEMHREAAYFYLDNLFKSKVAMNYLSDRKITLDTAKRFGLGYAPDNWSSLKDFLMTKGYKEEDILKANLITRSEKSGNTYDAFRSRLVFPLIDLKKRVVGFSGRIIGDGEPKYYNSRDSYEFTKGNLLFGLNMVQNNKNRDKIMLVEGNIDVVKLHQMGINYVVAALGTAFTSRQAQLLKRFGNQIFLCLDGDSAGKKATLKAIETLQNQGSDPKIVEIPDNMDPDEYIDKFGVNSFKALLLDAKSPFDFVVDYHIEGKSLERHDDFISFIRGVISYIKTVPDPISRDVYIKSISNKYDISMDALNEEFRSISNNNEDSDSDFTIPRAENKWPRTLINVMITEKANAIYLQNMNLDEYLPDNNVKYLYNKINELYEKNEVIDIDELKNEVNKDEKMDVNFLSWLEKLNLNARETEKLLRDITRSIKLASEQKETGKIVRQIETVENYEDAMELLKELDKMHERKWYCAKFSKTKIDDGVTFIFIWSRLKDRTCDI